MRLLVLMIAIVCTICTADARGFENETASFANTHETTHRRLTPHPAQSTQTKPVHENAGVRIPHKFRGHIYHGAVAWDHGHWHHTTHKGRFGWWWDVGGVWYLYSEPTEGAPSYVSDVEAQNQTTTTQSSPSTTQPSSTPEVPEETHFSVYYRPGDLDGVKYQTLEECWAAMKQAGNVGICVRK